MEGSERKHSVFGFLAKLVALAGTAYVGARVLMTHFAKDKKKQPEQEGELEYYLNFTGKKIGMNSKDTVKKIYLNSNFSGTDLNLVQMDIKEDIRIDCNLFMSAVSIRVPENVEVVLDNQMKMSAMSNAVPSYYKEENPTLCISLHGCMSAVSIQCKASEEGNQ